MTNCREHVTLVESDPEMRTASIKVDTDNLLYTSLVLFNKELMCYSAQSIFMKFEIFFNVIY